MGTVGLTRPPTSETGPGEGGRSASGKFSSNFSSKFSTAAAAVVEVGVVCRRCGGGDNNNVGVVSISAVGVGDGVGGGGGDACCVVVSSVFCVCQCWSVGGAGQLCSWLYVAMCLKVSEILMLLKSGSFCKVGGIWCKK